jgi:hypothetical protein
MGLLDRTRRTWIAAAAMLVALAIAPPAQAVEPEVSTNGYDTWYVARSLDGLDPGDETVESLYVEHVGPGTREGLGPLARFPDLRHLELEVVSGVDLEPLADLRLESLSLRYVRDVDLAPLADMKGLGALSALNLRDVRVPPALALPASLRVLSLYNDGFRETGAPVKAMVEAIDWSALGRLRDLDLIVGDEPIRVDLGFLRGLPKLQRIEIPYGVHHHGEVRSPFAGLAPSLRQIWIDAWQPDRVKRALKRQYPRASVYVQKRHRWDPSQRDFALMPPDDGIRTWGCYGSLWEVFDGRYRTEYAAERAARRMLRRAAPRLLRRLEFDPESDGTGIDTRRRRDLVRALRILGIR